MLTSPTPRLRTALHGALTLLALSHLFGLLLAVSLRRGGFHPAAQPLRTAGGDGVCHRDHGRRFCSLCCARAAADAAGGNFWLKFTPQFLAWSVGLVFTPVGLVLAAYGILRWRGPTASIRFDALLVQALAPTALMFLGALVISLHNSADQ